MEQDKDLFLVEKHSEDPTTSEKKNDKPSQKKFSILLETKKWTECRDYQRDSMKSFFEGEKTNVKNTFSEMGASVKFNVEDGSMEYQLGFYFFSLKKPWRGNPFVDFIEDDFRYLIMKRESGSEALMRERV
jgi:hypothetical protein